MDTMAFPVPIPAQATRWRHMKPFEARRNEASKVLRKQDVCKELGFSRAHLDRLRASGQFIQPVRLGAQAIGWLADEVEIWLASRPRAAQ